MTDEPLQPKCPECDSLNVEPRGCAMSVSPGERPTSPFDGQPRLRKVVKYQYRCLDCDEPFSITEEC